MSILIVDKETNKQITVAAGETNNRTPPVFTGTGINQDPLKFLEDYEKVAKWNNWRAEDRKKETFLLCLSGAAERWMKNHLDKEAIEDMEFDNGKPDCLVSRFKDHFITDKWYDIYIKQYEERNQGQHETPLEYMEIKSYMWTRAGPELEDKTPKQRVRDIMKGLLPPVKSFCETKLKDPFFPDAKRTLDTLDGLEKLLQWAEAYLYEDKKVLSSEVARTSEEVSMVNNVGRNHSSTTRNYEDRTGPRENSSYHNNRGSQQQQYTEFERQVLSHLGKLDTIENDLANLKDRVELMEKNSKNVGGAKFMKGNTDEDGNPRCFNCQRYGHFGRDCTQPCRTCENSNHCGGNCPVRFDGTKGKRPMVKSVNFMEEEGESSQQDFQ